MSPKVVFASALLAVAGLLYVGPAARAADSLLPPGTLKAYANELNAAFPQQVDIFLIGREYDFTRPAISDAHIEGCAQVAGVLYYVVTLSNKSELFIPQSQVQAIHNRKGK